MAAVLFAIHPIHTEAVSDIQLFIPGVINSVTRRVGSVSTEFGAFKIFHCEIKWNLVSSIICSGFVDILV